ncbi:MAG: rRNA maturation RNase YbeY [Bacteroidota bacterium]|nr:rRNA maturation RNase YbeY [Bacteroidota bacterium]
MPEAPINFFSEDVSYLLKNKIRLRFWLEKCAFAEKKKIGTLNYVFCSDLYLKKINKRFLDHNYFTDIITFPDSEPAKNRVGGDIFISIDRVKENSLAYNATFSKELHRVMVHGLLHLCGYEDKTDQQQKKMRKMEDYYLQQLDS